MYLNKKISIGVRTKKSRTIIVFPALLVGSGEVIYMVESRLCRFVEVEGRMAPNFSYVRL